MIFDLFSQALLSLVPRRAQFGCMIVTIIVAIVLIAIAIWVSVAGG